MTACWWCSDGFEPRRTGGSKQRFCGSNCRRAFDQAGRDWIRLAMDAGLLTVPCLRNAAATARALVPAQGRRPRLSRPARTEPCALVSPAVAA
jgi:hypothetical protein